MDYLSNKLVVTRKDHNCWGCGRKFKKGSKLTSVVTADGGYISRIYWCGTCLEIIDENNEYDDYAYGDLINEYPEKYEKN